MLKRIVIGIALVSVEGLNAQWINSPTRTESHINAVYFLTEEKGFITAGNSVFMTTDAGASWSQSAFDSSQLYGLVFESSFLGFVAGSRAGKGMVLRTTDGGQSWVEGLVGFGNAYFDISFVDSENGWIFGEVGSQIGKVGRTTDGGITWMDQRVDAFGPMLGGCFVDESNGWAVGEQPSFIRTTNGGSSWFEIDTVFLRSDSAVPMRDVQFLDLQQGFAVGGIAERNVIQKTIDGGTNWSHKYFEPQFPEPEFGVARLNDLCFTGYQTGYVAGRDFASGPEFLGIILKTTDGGVSWSKQEIGSAHELNSVFFLTDSIGWAAGDWGTLIQTSNGGVSEIEGGDQPFAGFSLLQNYPNPFNPFTTIRYSLSRRASISMRVYSVVGQEVATLVEGEKDPGYHEVKFNAVGLSSGVYVCRLTTGDFVQSRKLLLLR